MNTKTQPRSRTEPKPSRKRSPEKYSVDTIKEKFKKKKALRESRKWLNESVNESRLGTSMLNKTVIEKQKGWINERRKLRTHVRELQDQNDKLIK